MLTRIFVKYVQFLPPYNKINKVGRKMKSQPPSFPLQHDLSQNSNSNGK